MAIKIFPTLALLLTTSGATASEQLGKSIQGLQEAKHRLADSRTFPPEPNDRNLAEGYRYMLPHLGRIIKMERRLHPRYPEFYRSVARLRKWTSED